MGGAKGYGDMTGQRFGKWTVLGMTARTSTDGHKRTACLCRCDCGTDATGIWPRVMIGVMALGQSLAHHLTK